MQTCPQGARNYASHNLNSAWSGSPGRFSLVTGIHLMHTCQVCLLFRSVPYTSPLSAPTSEFKRISHFSVHLEPFHSTENLKQKPVTVTNLRRSYSRDVFIRNTVRPDKQFHPRADSFPPFSFKKTRLLLCGLGLLVIINCLRRVQPDQTYYVGLILHVRRSSLPLTTESQSMQHTYTALFDCCSVVSRN
jgi:hypothetical protein